MFKKCASQKGRSLIEMLATLTIITLITLGAIEGTRMIMLTFHPISVQNDLEQAARDINDMYLWKKGYSTISMPFLCKNKVFRCDGTGKASNPWGGTIDVASKTADSFEITLSNVPKAACNGLLRMKWTFIHPTDKSCSTKQSMIFTSVSPLDETCPGGSCGPEPDYCEGVTCNGHGSCNPSTGNCVCTGGWTGYTCGTPPNLCTGWISTICQPLCNPTTGNKTNASLGTACTLNNSASGYCDGNGSCVASKCEGWTASICQTACDKTTGNKTNAASGTTCTISTSGDGVCNGNGVCEKKDLCKDVTCPAGVSCNPATGYCLCSFSCPAGRHPDDGCMTCVCNDPTMMGLNCDIKASCPTSSTGSSSPSYPSACKACPNKGVVSADARCYACGYSDYFYMDDDLINDPVYGCTAVCPNRYVEGRMCRLGGNSCPTSSTGSSSKVSPAACKACPNKGVVDISGDCYACNSSDYFYMDDDLINDPVYGCTAVCPNRYMNGTICKIGGNSCPTSSTGISGLSSPAACKACTHKGVVDEYGRCAACDYSDYVYMGDLINDPVYGCTAVCPNRYVEGTSCYLGGNSCPASSTDDSRDSSPAACKACPNKGIVNTGGTCYACDSSSSVGMGDRINDPVYGCTAVCPNRWVNDGWYCNYKGASCPTSSTEASLPSSPAACKACPNKGVVDKYGKCYACNYSSSVDMGDLVNDPVYGCTAVCPNRFVYMMSCRLGGNNCPTSSTEASSPSSPAACKACPNKGIVNTGGTCYACDSSSSVGMGDRINDPVYGCRAVCPNRWVSGGDCMLSGNSCPTSSTDDSSPSTPAACKACPNKGVVDRQGRCYACDYSDYVYMGDRVNDPVYGCTAVCPNRWVSGGDCNLGGNSCPASSTDDSRDSSPAACKACPNKGIVNTGGTCYACDSSSPVDMGDLVNDPVYGCRAVCPNRWVSGTRCLFG